MVIIIFFLSWASTSTDCYEDVRTQTFYHRSRTQDGTGRSRASLEENGTGGFLFRRALFDGLRDRGNPARAGRCCSLRSGRRFQYVVPISIGIAVLLVIVATSYRQTIHAYPSGGGAYIVAKENLGTTPDLVAGASLLVDYVLTVAVSIAAGVAAITSVVQGTRYAWLDDHKVLLCLIFIVFIALANLRGVRESGALFAAPTYAFSSAFSS